MSKNIDFWKIGLGYRYAPESCYVTELQRDGTYKRINIDLSGYMCGYNLSIGKTDKAISEIKDIMRKIRNGKHRFVTFGFFIKGSQNEYVYCRDRALLAGEYNMARKLEIFKQFKQHWLDNGCKYHNSSIAKLDGTYAIESVKKEYEKVDLTRPLKIYVNLS